MTATTRTTIS